MSIFANKCGMVNRFEPVWTITMNVTINTNNNKPLNKSKLRIIM